MVRSIGKDPSMIRKVTCSHCASILEYYDRDVKSQSYRDWDGTTDVSHSIECCDCGKPVSVSKYR